MGHDAPFCSGSKSEKVQIIPSNGSSLEEFERLVNNWLATNGERVIVIERSYSLVAVKQYYASAAQGYVYYREVAIWYREKDKT